MRRIDARMLRANAIWIAALCLMAGCSDDPAAPEKISNTNPNAASINEYVAALPQWPELLPETIEDVEEDPIIVHEDSDGLDYQCGSIRRTQFTPLERIEAAGMDEDEVWPGQILQGARVEAGEPERLPLARSPITLRIDVPIANQSRVVTEPNSVTIQQAVADLIREAADGQGTLDPIRSNINFQVTEAHSFAQAMVSMGVGGGFQEPYSGIALNGNIESGANVSIRTHSAVILLKQEMFTISFADDLPYLSEAAGFFAPGVDMDALTAQENAGNIGADNLPVYVKSVTYGRLLMASIKSTEVASGQKLAAAAGAAYDDYAGNAQMSEETRALLQASSWQYAIFGGSQDAADNAIGSLDWSEYFTPTLATTAVPLSFELRTLREGERAGIQEAVEYGVRGSCQAPRAYELSITLQKVSLGSGNCLTGCTWASSAKTASQDFPLARTWVFDEGFVSNLNPVKNPDKTRTFEFVDGERFWVTGAHSPTQFDASKEWNYPFAAFRNKNAEIYELKVSNPITQVRIDFRFRIRKAALY